MTPQKKFLACALASIVSITSPLSMADNKHSGGIHSPTKNTQHQRPLADFDIVHTKITTQNNIVTFHMAVAGNAGSNKPNSIGKLAGSSVYSYVWPTSINSSAVGFEKDAGILALAVTAHPDFDDTPLYDENADNNLKNDGNIWHSHWVVLHPNEQCGKGALGVVDIPKGGHPKLPKTWPGLPLLLDSPGWDPVFDQGSLTISVPFDNISSIKQAQYDGVTAGLRVNQSLHAPLLCVVDVMDIASGDLSLPAKIQP